MSCQYGFYKDNELNRPKLYCSITNDMCVYSKLCLKPSINKYVFNEKVNECMIKRENEKHAIPSGAYYVRFVKNGYAYVELSDKVVKVKCEDEIDNYIYINQNSDGTYEGSTSPFNETTVGNKKRNKRKKRVEENERTTDD